MSRLQTVAGTLTHIHTCDRCVFTFKFTFIVQKEWKYFIYFLCTHANRLDMSIFIIWLHKCLFHMISCRAFRVGFRPRRICMGNLFLLSLFCMFMVDDKRWNGADNQICFFKKKLCIFLSFLRTDMRRLFVALWLVYHPTLIITVAFCISFDSMIQIFPKLIISFRSVFLRPLSIHLLLFISYK